MIQRKSPLRRSTKPIPKKRKARSWKSPRCIYESPTGRHTCKKAQQHLERCKHHADAYLDSLRGALVRKDHCEVEHRDSRWVGKPFPCNGPIQDNHGIPRGNWRTRWVVANGLSGCSSVNIWAHQNKNAWNAYLIRHWGIEKYAHLMELSVSGPLPDYEEVLKELSR